MKKLFAIVLAVVLVAAVSVTAFAAESPTGELKFDVTVSASNSNSGKVEKVDNGDGTVTLKFEGEGFKKWDIDGTYDVVDGSLETATITIKPTSEIKAVADCGEAEDVDYYYIEGANGTWTVGSGDDLRFRVNGEYSKFTEVKIDGETLDESNYTSESGSTIIVLKNSYLETLETGKHTITTVYVDGEATTEFTVKSEEETSPETGNAPIAACAAVLVSALGAAYVAKKNLSK